MNNISINHEQNFQIFKFEDYVHDVGWASRPYAGSNSDQDPYFSQVRIDINDPGFIKASKEFKPDHNYLGFTSYLQLVVTNTFRLRRWGSTSRWFRNNKGIDYRGKKGSIWYSQLGNYTVIWEAVHDGFGEILKDDDPRRNLYCSILKENLRRSCTHEGGVSHIPWGSDDLRWAHSREMNYDCTVYVGSPVCV